MHTFCVSVALFIFSKQHVCYDGHSLVYSFRRLLLGPATSVFSEGSLLADARETEDENVFDTGSLNEFSSLDLAHLKES